MIANKEKIVKIQIKLVLINKKEKQIFIEELNNIPLTSSVDKI